MIHHLRASTIAIAAALAAPAAWAETPPDTLIQAWAIDDVISLDPAEVFEFTASEVLGTPTRGSSPTTSTTSPTSRARSPSRGRCPRTG